MTEKFDRIEWAAEMAALQFKAFSQYGWRPKDGSGKPLDAKATTERLLNIMGRLIERNLARI